MANHKSTLKRAKQNKVKNFRNKSIKTQVKKIIKNVKAADADSAKNIFVKAQSVIDKASKKGVLHKRTSARKISRLAKTISG